ncbi:DUF2637 domain-containing protein [Phytohabitans rumicis]|uniref:DUF2637 domain-containing protein n=1 Tax=Phytohabitans rumicis TaxID=1076125 RepID=A0A6V8LCB2_9ACTN|nr:DUF2637 domain-containing protein [Phytohabitans rumicis]GFJ91687.1 hypothetical protein Prum_053290 [Phytohabitans rumicis]
MSRISGRGWAYAGALLGGAVSVAANVAHSYVPPAAAVAAWSPQPGSVVGAMFWPVALFVAVEILARVPWPAGARWVALRFAGLLPVALVAAVVSYRHLSGLLAFYGEDAITAAVGPLAVDGLMVMATGALLATSGRRRPAPAVVVEPVEVPAPVPVVEPAVAEPPAVELVDVAPPVEPGAPERPARKPSRRQSAAERVARAVRRTPHASPAAVAARLKLSERTVQRHWPASTVDMVTTAGGV